MTDPEFDERYLDVSDGDVPTRQLLRDLGETQSLPLPQQIESVLNKMKSQQQNQNMVLNLIEAHLGTDSAKIYAANLETFLRWQLDSVLFLQSLLEEEEE